MLFVWFIWPIGMLYMFPKFVLIILLICSLMTSLEAVTMMMNKNRNCMCPLKWQLCLMVRNTMKVMQCTLSIGDCVRKKCTAHAHLDCLLLSTNRIINYFVALKLSWLGDVLWSNWIFRLRRKLTLGPLALHQAPVVQTLDSAIHWINHYPLDNSIRFSSVYPLDSDLSGGQRYPLFE